MRPKIHEYGFGVQYASGMNGRFRIFHCMADSSNVVIAPDGALFPCEHCPPESKFGDIFWRITDEEARSQFCRTDLVRKSAESAHFFRNVHPLAIVLFRIHTVGRFENYLQ